jgi:hypothetical protein
MLRQGRGSVDDVELFQPRGGRFGCACPRSHRHGRGAHYACRGAVRVGWALVRPISAECAPAPLRDRRPRSTGSVLRSRGWPTRHRTGWKKCSSRSLVHEAPPRRVCHRAGSSISDSTRPILGEGEQRGSTRRPDGPRRSHVSPAARNSSLLRSGRSSFQGPAPARPQCGSGDRPRRERR